MNKSLDLKLADIRNNSASKEFIIADARDADMTFGIASPGPHYPAIPGRENTFRSMKEFEDDVRATIAQGKIDIMLASVSMMHRLAHEENLFENSAITPAIRANDTTDVWCARGARYRESPSRPFSTCYLAEAQHGIIQPTASGIPKVNLGLYSMTFNNDRDADHESLTAFRNFRAEAQRLGFRYFLEVFDPNCDAGLSEEAIPAYVNDCIVRSLAAVPAPSRPEFLKIAYHGPRWLEELVNYDPTMVVGVLGGGSGTTLDAFQLLHDAQKYGARVALFGRKIKDAEHPLTFVSFLRCIVDEGLNPRDAVKAYHGELQKLNLPAKRSLEDDLKITSTELSYGG